MSGLESHQEVLRQHILDLNERIDMKDAAAETGYATGINSLSYDRLSMRPRAPIFLFVNEKLCSGI